MVHAVLVPRDVGFVYVLVNSAMPELVKVGMTSRLAEDRARDLFTTGVAQPFEVAFRMATSRPREVEARAHKILDKHRRSPRREFFEVDPDSARRAIQQAALDVAGLLYWDSLTEPTKIVDGERLALHCRAGEILVLYSYPSSQSGGADYLDIWQIHADGDCLELMGSDDESVIASFSTEDPLGVHDPVPYLDRDEEVPNGLLSGREALLRGQRLLWLDGVNYGKTRYALFDFDTTCQVVARTWDPQQNEEGWPLILNTLVRDVEPHETQVVQAIARLQTIEISGPPGVYSPATREADPDFWLRQLRKHRAKKNRNNAEKKETEPPDQT